MSQNSLHSQRLACSIFGRSIKTRRSDASKQQLTAVHSNFKQNEELVCLYYTDGSECQSRSGKIVMVPKLFDSSFGPTCALSSNGTEQCSIYYLMNPFNNRQGDGHLSY